MKYNSGHFLQIPRKIFECELSWQARSLYLSLKELEHRFAGKKENFFFRSTDDLRKDTGMNAGTIRKYRAELVNAELLQAWKMHWLDKETGRKSEKHVMAFRLL